MSEQTTLADLVAALAARREELLAVNDAYQIAYSTFLSTQAARLNNKTELTQEIEELELSIHTAGMQMYDATHNRTPAPGVTVKMFTVMRYHDSVVLEWCKAHDIALTFDRKVFEKIAQADPPPFVQIAQEPRVQIATDLRKAIGEVRA